LTLTFAEIEFILLACPQRADAIRGQLGLGPRDEAAAAAGLSSLLARRLCEPADGDAKSVRPGPAIKAVIAAFASGTSHTVAAAWLGDQSDLMHVYTAPAVRLTLFPYRHGRFAVQVLDPGEAVSAVLDRYLAAHLATGQLTALVAKSTTDGETIALTAAVDASGRWSSSDSVGSPEAAAPSSRAEFRQRMAELLDGRGPRRSALYQAANTVGGVVGGSTEVQVQAQAQAAAEAEVERQW
jgi:hypothetical protein